MPRGNFWEATYDPDWDGPVEAALLTNLPGSSGFVDRQVMAPNGEAASLRWTRRDPIRHFSRCDFALTVRGSLVSNCKFTRCRFRNSLWDDVKFSNCIFDHCDFSECTFSKCVFVRDCQFIAITASAELFRIEDTAISARAFIRGLATNLQHLPASTNPAYQLHRFARTREKLAKALYTATRHEADVEYYHEAYEELTRATLRYRIEQHRFRGSELSNTPRIQFFLRSLPPRLERTLVVTSAWLTDWGRSILRAALFVVTIVLSFAYVYGVLDGTPVTQPARAMVYGFAEAFNITIVAGYTAHYTTAASELRQGIWAVNVALGLFWYSLIVPGLIRRILR